MNLESKARINSLISAANATTGKADTDLTSAVGALIAGFGQGGDDTTFLEVVQGTITELSNDKITHTSRAAFGWQPNLLKAYLPNLKIVGTYTFTNCEKLTEVDLPQAEEMGGYVFSGCSSLITLNLPKVAKFFGGDIFANTKLTSLVLPELVALANSTMRYAKSLIRVDLPKLVRINPETFKDDNALIVLILRASSLCSLANINAFNGTPLASGGTGGTVYVPSALIAEYQQATNWSTLYAAGTCNFVAIEGSEYE